MHHRKGGGQGRGRTADLPLFRHGAIDLLPQVKVHARPLRASRVRLASLCSECLTELFQARDATDAGCPFDPCRRYARRDPEHCWGHDATNEAEATEIEVVPGRRRLQM